MKVDIAHVRDRIRREHAKLEYCFLTQRAVGGLKNRESFKCSSAELWDIVERDGKQQRDNLVRLVVLHEAVSSNRLLRWLLSRWTARIAKAVDEAGPI